MTLVQKFSTFIEVCRYLYPIICMLTPLTYLQLLLALRQPGKCSLQGPAENIRRNVILLHAKDQRQIVDIYHSKIIAAPAVTNNS